jgi:hypothetical protein
LKDAQGRPVFVKCVWFVNTLIQDILDVKLKQKVICVHNMDTFLYLKREDRFHPRGLLSEVRVKNVTPHTIDRSSSFLPNFSEPDLHKLFRLLTSTIFRP